MILVTSHGGRGGLVEGIFALGRLPTNQQGRGTREADGTQVQALEIAGRFWQGDATLATELVLSALGKEII